MNQSQPVPIEAGETVAALQVRGARTGEDVSRLVVRTAKEFSDNLAAEPR